MSRLGITFEEVAEAADNIQAQGQIPTIDKIRHYLGGTGSNTTISKYLSQWRNNQLPSGIALRDPHQHTPDIVKSAVDKVWQEIKDQADAEIAAAKTLAEEQIEVANKHAASAIQALNELKEQHQQLSDSFNHLMAEKELLALDIKALRAEHQQLEAEHQHLHNQFKETERLTGHHLHDLKQAQEKERISLAEQYAEREKLLTAINHETKKQTENERQQQLITIDNLNTTQQKLLKSIEELKLHEQAQTMTLNHMQTALTLAETERDATKQQVAEQQICINQLASNILIPENTLAELVQQPKIEDLLGQLTPHLVDTLDRQFIAFKKWLEAEHVS